MLGNWKGWTISAVILAVEIGAVVWALKLDDLTAPTSFVKQDRLFDKLALPVSPQRVVPMSGAEDVTPLYQEALKDYAARTIDYETLDNADEPRLTNFRAIVFAQRAAKQKPAPVLTPRMGEVLRFGKNDREPLLQAEKFGKLLIRLAQHEDDHGRPAQAIELYEAAFALGANLWEERLVWQEADIGLSLMADAAAGLGAMPGIKRDLNRSDAIKEFLQARSDYIQHTLWPTWKVIADLDDGPLREHAGDMFVLASDRMQEQMWRVEAVWKLGYMRFNTGPLRQGDSFGATRVTTAMAKDEPDPVVKQAAKVASELTEAEWRRR
ncbi:MAG: hypothetical protein QM770_04290 [Tepidisphaeraceae bacterium]